MADYRANRAGPDACRSSAVNSSRPPERPGSVPPAILRRHIIPNLVGPMIVYATLTIPQMILFESFLSFLGLGRAGAARQPRQPHQ